MKNKKVKQQNFVVKNMIKHGVGSSVVHKDKRYEAKQKIRGKKHKVDYKKESFKLSF